MQVTPLFWIIFTAAVIALLLSDLLVRRQTHVSLGQALATTLGWIALSAGFGLWVTWRGGAALGLQFFTGYLIEYALSMDNVFIFILIFASFRIPAVQQHRILFWGVIGAMVMRGFMVAGGTLLLRNFGWVTYLFGAYILYAGVAMLFPKKETKIEENGVVRLARRFLPLSAETGPVTFVTREAGQLRFTLLFLVLIVIEATDLVFALDSVPAVFAVTRDPFIVYTSNICAILGLRSLYFLLADAMRHLAYLHVGLAAVLVFIGAKMIGENFYPLSTTTSLLVVGAILALALAASFLKPKRNPSS
jgi:tellurite resistance protein TerC